MRRFTDGLLALAMRIAPREKAEWFVAMRAEADHVPSAQRVRFAFGCLRAAVGARVLSPAFVQEAARQILVGGALGWAAMNLWFAGRVSTAETASLEMGAYVAAVLFALGAIATARFGFRATTALGVPLALVLMAVTVALWLFASPSPATDMHIALLVEDLAILLFALAIAVAAPRLAGQLGAR